MDLSPEEMTFMRELVKGSRQRSQHVKWTDRDGTERLTVLTVAEAAKLNTLAHRLKLSKGEVLRQAAHIPNAQMTTVSPSSLATPPPVPPVE
ncbi:MAG: hypothetical protein ABIQ12_09460 [Opitutaceae bacterium]